VHLISFPLPVQFGRESGRDAPGLYPEWDATHPVHLIGHSFGGTTCRALVQLLADGGAGMGEDEHVFGGGTSASWVLSVTTVATPHDGTPLVSVLDRWMGTIFASLGMAAGVAGAADSGSVYDFKLDQWGIEPRRSEEPWAAYSARVQGAALWKDHRQNRDLIHHDLSMEGAAEVNAWVGDWASVRYFSYQTCSSSPDPFSSIGNELPHLATNPMFVATGLVLGRIDEKASGRRPGVGREWRRNDGLVSCRSQRAPTLEIHLPVDSSEGASADVGEGASGVDVDTGPGGGGAKDENGFKNANGSKNAPSDASSGAFLLLLQPQKPLHPHHRTPLAAQASGPVLSWKLPTSRKGACDDVGEGASGDVEGASLGQDAALDSSSPPNAGVLDSVGEGAGNDVGEGASAVTGHHQGGPLDSSSAPSPPTGATPLRVSFH